MHLSSVIKKTEFFTELFLYAACLVPLIIAQDSSIFPFVFPKAIYFEITVGVALVGMAGLWGLSAPSRPRRGPFIVVLITYAVLLFISSMQGIDPPRSLWSNHERMTGVIYVWHAMMFGLLVACYYYMKPERLKYFLWYVCGVSSVVALSGIVQAFNPNFLISMSKRAAGTLGNPIYLGGLSAMMLVLNGYFVFAERRSLWRWFFVLGVVLNGAALYFSGTRGAAVSLFVAAVVAICWYAPRAWLSEYRKHFIATVVAGVAIVGLLFVLVRADVIPNDSTINRLFDARGFTTTLSTRVIAWKIAYEGFLEKPVLGWGPENFFYVFNKYYNPKSLLFGSYETWFDHAHNAPLDILVTQGALGLFVYLSLYVVAWWHAIRTRPQNGTDELLTVVLLLMLVMHFVQNLFVFDHPVSYAYFYLFFGVLVARYWHRDSPLQAQLITARQTYPAVLVVTQGALLLLVMYISVPSIRMNSLDYQAQVVARTGNLKVAQQLFQQARAINGPHLPDVLLDIGRVSQQHIFPENVAERQVFYRYGLSALDELILKYERYNLLAVLMQAQNLTVGVQAGNKTLIAPAEAAYRSAAQLSPLRQQIYYSWGRLYYLTRQNVEGVKIIQKAIDAEPRVATSYWYMALFSVDFDAAKAVQALNKALELGYEVRGTMNVLISASIYARAGEYANSAALYERALDDSQSRDWGKPIIKDAYETAGKARRPELQKRIKDLFPAEFKK